MNTNNNTSGLSIRLAVPGDHPVIADFQVRMARETENLRLDPETVSAGVRSVLEDPSLGKYYVAVCNRRIAGSLLVTYEWSDWRNGQVWWIQSVYILPEFRNMKIFRSMYHFLKEMVQDDPGLVGLRLYVDRKNRLARKVYESLGMNGQHYKTYEWIK